MSDDLEFQSIHSGRSERRLEHEARRERKGNWSTWQSPPSAVGKSSCGIMWQDSWFIFGGTANGFIALKFNFSTSTWTSMSNMPTAKSNFGCSLLSGTNTIVFLYWNTTTNNSMTEELDLTTNTWVFLGGTQLKLMGRKLIAMGSRLFAVGGGSAQVEEFTSIGEWQLLNVTLQNAHAQSGLISLPAGLFNFFPMPCTGT